MMKFQGLFFSFLCVGILYSWTTSPYRPLSIVSFRWKNESAMILAALWLVINAQKKVSSDFFLSWLLEHRRVCGQRTSRKTREWVSLKLTHWMLHDVYRRPEGWVSGHQWTSTLRQCPPPPPRLFSAFFVIVSCWPLSSFSTNIKIKIKKNGMKPICIELKFY